MSVHLHRSHRTENLATALAEVLEVPLDDPFVPERLIVPSRGMAQWVSLALAEELGVAAHLAFWTPREAVDALLAAYAPPGPQPAAWDRDTLSWSLLSILVEHRADPALSALSAWISDADVARVWELAQRVAYTFDQYAVYRPDEVLVWSAGGGDGWEPVLWRMLESKLGKGHVAARAKVLEGSAPAAALPARLCAFGLTTLPPLYLDVLSAVAPHVDVHLFQLAPSREYWADIRTRREILRAALRSGITPAEEAARGLHFDVGHPLLASLGRVGRDFQLMIEKHLDYQDDDVDRDEDPGQASILHTLQSDILALRVRADADEEAPRLALPASDRSFQVIGCHSAAREIEVLRDRLWDLLHADPSLTPRDIAVLVPDIREHGPLIEAVFGVDPKHPLYLPFHMADRRLTDGNLVAGALLAVLERARSRMTAPDVVDLLAHAPIRTRFGLAESELADVAALVTDAGIRWGRDLAHRAAVGQPPVEDFTWRLGLDRLLLGHAMDVDTPFLGRVACVDVEGEVAERVGRLAAFVESLFSRLDSLDAPRPVARWTQDLRAWIDDWFDDESSAEDAQRVRERLNAMASSAASAGWEGDVPGDVIFSLLEDQLREERRVGGFLRGGVTFCEMLPMRAVPFRVIALVGMSDGGFPRADARSGFDRMQHEPRLGDRSKRYDDRYLVLEALLSARDALLFSFISRGVSDNRALPPSVVLADVLDALDSTFVPEEGHKLARDAVIVHHPLQPFSVVYVSHGDDRLRTWDHAASMGAHALAAGLVSPPPWLEGPMPPKEPVTDIDLRALERFLADPVRWFLTRRLGIRAAEDDASLEDAEPFELDELAEHGLGDRMMALWIEHRDWTRAELILRGESRLPLGQLARPVLARVARRVKGIVDAADPRLAEPRRAPIPVDIQVGGVRVIGRLDQVRGGACVSMQYSNVARGQGRLRLRAWIRHLALQICAGPGDPRVTEVYGRSGDESALQLALPPLDPAVAHQHLAALVERYIAGQTRPAPFLPDAGWAWQSVIADKGPGVAQKVARKAADDTWMYDTESAARWVRVYGEDPWSRRDVVGAFEEISERVFAGLYNLEGA